MTELISDLCVTWTLGSYQIHSLQCSLKLLLTFLDGLLKLFTLMVSSFLVFLATLFVSWARTHCLT